MHINESSKRRIGGTVNVNLGRYRGSVAVNLGGFGDDYTGPGSPNYDYNAANSAAAGGQNTGYDVGEAYVQPAINPGIYPGQPSPGSGYTYPAMQTQPPPDGSNTSWLSSLFGTTIAAVPGIISAVKGNNPVVNGRPVQGAIYQAPMGNMGIIVPVVIGTVVLVGAALLMKKRPSGSMAGYRRRRMRR